MTLSALLVIIIPGVQLAVSSVDGLKTLNTKLGSGELKVPPPPEGVGILPFIGGFISFGFLGLFIVAVILSVVYKLLEVWLQEDTQSLPVVEASGPVD
jgi:predicted PurR-regulated permease PerM